MKRPPADADAASSTTGARAGAGMARRMAGSLSRALAMDGLSQKVMDTFWLAQR